MSIQKTLRDEFPNVVLAARRPLVFEVEFSQVSGTLQTLEGAVAYDAGAAIVTGLHGEKWPIAIDRFAKTFELVEGSTIGQRGRYRRRPQTVLAHCLVNASEVIVPEERGVLGGHAGDWLVEYGPGDRAIVAAEIFEMTYEVLG